MKKQKGEIILGVLLIIGMAAGMIGKGFNAKPVEPEQIVDTINTARQLGLPYKIISNATVPKYIEYQGHGYSTAHWSKERKLAWQLKQAKIRGKVEVSEIYLTASPAHSYAHHKKINWFGKKKELSQDALIEKMFACRSMVPITQRQDANNYAVMEVSSFGARITSVTCKDGGDPLIRKAELKSGWKLSEWNPYNFKPKK